MTARKPDVRRRLRLWSLPTGAKLLAAALLCGVTAVAGAGVERPRLPLLALANLPHAPRVDSLAELALRGETEALPPRDRLVSIENVNTGEKATFGIGPGGYVRSDQALALERFFRCRRTERQNPIHPRVLDLLAQVGERWPGRVIEIISGFRAPPFGVPNSRHFVGNAIDLRVRGVPLTAVRDFLWREHRGVGVGYYAHSNFVHVDTRSEDRAAAWSAREESETPDYNPRWAQLARRDHSHAH